MRKYSYVYRLVDKYPIDNRKYYIGCRTCEYLPSEDNYYSSSNDIKELIKSGHEFDKEILEVFENRIDAINYEIKLHQKYDVSNNPEFYNKVKQTSTKFDTSGYIFIDGKRISSAEYIESEKLIYHSKGKINVRDKNNNILYLDVTDEKYLSGEYSYLTQGKMAVFVDGKYEMIETSEYYENRVKYTTSNTNKVPVKNDVGDRLLIDKSDIRYINGEFKSVHKGKILAKDIDGNIMYVSEEEFKRLKLTGINKGKIGGEDNPNSKIIHIFNELSEVVFKCNGNFKKICKENNLPFISLKRSYINKGRRIYITSRGQVEASKRGNIKYIGWYAHIIN
jgi:hypothetical protein